jgi:hypothetical protein
MVGTLTSLPYAANFSGNCLMIPGSDVVLPLRLHPCHRLVLGEREVQVEEIDDILLRPVGVRSTKERCDVLGVPAPLLVRLLELLLVLRHGRGDEVAGDHNVLLEQFRQSFAGLGPIEGDNGVADVFLVLE